MRLLYIRNKPELAMELFMDEVNFIYLFIFLKFYSLINQNLKNIFHDSGSALILLNKLIEDKRYDDAIKIFEYGSQRGFSTTSGRTYPTDVVMLTVEALYRQVKKFLLNKKNK